jgi:hypothetical protein
MRDQATMPAQDRRRRHQTMLLDRLGQHTTQRGQDRPVGPVQARSWIPAAQHRDLMTQHEQFGVLARTRPRQQHQPADDPNEDQIQQPKRHKPRSSPTRR